MGILVKLWCRSWQVVCCAGVQMCVCVAWHCLVGEGRGGGGEGSGSFLVMYGYIGIHTYMCA